MMNLREVIDQMGADSARVKYRDYVVGSRELKGLCLGTVASTLDAIYGDSEYSYIDMINMLQGAEHNAFRQLIGE